MVQRGKQATRAARGGKLRKLPVEKDEPPCGGKLRELPADKDRPPCGFRLRAEEVGLQDACGLNSFSKTKGACGPASQHSDSLNMLKDQGWGSCRLVQCKSRARGLNPSNLSNDERSGAAEGVGQQGASKQRMLKGPIVP
ncbi:hypothetical protein Ancab_023242 [Ancistrocladus abbreviatus]